MKTTAKNKEALSQVYNVALRESSTLNELVEEIKTNLSDYDSEIKSTSKYMDQIEHEIYLIRWLPLIKQNVY